MNKGKLIIAFVGGAIFGAAGMYAYCKHYYEHMEYEVVSDPDADDEVADVEFDETGDESESDDGPKIRVEKVDDTEVDENVTATETIIANHDYTDYSNMSETELDEAAEEAVAQAEEDRRTPPYVITEDQYNETRLDYDKLMCLVYTDGIVVDEAEAAYVGETSIEEVEPMDIEDLGEDNINAFLASDDKEWFVRNKKLGADYALSKANCESDEYAEKQ